MEGIRFQIDAQSQLSEDQIQNGYLFYAMQNQRIETNNQSEDHGQQPQEQEDVNP